MRVAAVNDVHGNIAALEAVLEEIESVSPDRIVFGGDVAAGPFPAETLDRLTALEDAVFIQGNGDRHMVETFDAGAPDGMAAWPAGRISAEHRDFLASFTDVFSADVDGLGPTVFCHGSPRSDEEVITQLTPDDRLAEFLADTQERTVVCGHTHMQFDRQIGWTRVLNAGAVGMPYQGRRGAFWLMLGPDVDFRRTAYDVEAFVARMRETGYPEAENLADILLRPPPPDEVAAFFEGIGPDPTVDAER